MEFYLLYLYLHVLIEMAIKIYKMFYLFSLDKTVCSAPDLYSPHLGLIPEKYCDKFFLEFLEILSHIIAYRDVRSF